MKQKIFFLLLLLVSFPSLLNACEGCKMATVNGLQEPQTLRAGFALSWSVLFLFFTLFILVGVLVWAIRSAYQQAEMLHRNRALLPEETA